MTEYSRIASGTFTTAATPVAQVVNLPFQPQRVRLRNITAYSAPAQNAVTMAEWDINMGQGVAAIEYIESASSPWITAVDYVGSLGISTYYAGLSLQLGAQIQIASIAKASPTVITTASAHGLSVGQVVILEGLFQSVTTGMPQMSNIPFVITAVGSPTTFTVTWNSSQSNYTALSGSPVGAFVRQVLYPFLYAPGVSVINTITANSLTNYTITTTAPHNMVAGQEVAFRISLPWATTQLNSLPNNTTPGSPIYGYVTAVNSSTSVTVTFTPNSAITAFTTNIAVAACVGLSPPQMIAVGDVNTGGVAFSGGNLYPSPVVNGFSTINGPAISGAFVNNTSQGFVIGLGTGTVNPSALLLAASSIYIWEALFYDFGS